MTAHQDTTPDSRFLRWRSLATTVLLLLFFALFIGVLEI